MPELQARERGLLGDLTKPGGLSNSLSYSSNSRRNAQPPLSKVTERGEDLVKNKELADKLQASLFLFRAQRLSEALKVLTLVLLSGSCSSEQTLALLLRGYTGHP